MNVRLRCAIYTRKSSEEGLEQNFNSLHAQREACEAYVLSQTGEGWTAIKTAYDDGGYSGGSIERPGLKQLLADIGRGLVDIVVVYKVDRLTRSLADFAKIVELFDDKGVSFVSVTQAFNTTTSMGRLTLNVLLSFAQFEREVTGERIRDKIAASKAKGLRMGGRPPLGYDIMDGRLAVNANEALRVGRTFERYLELGRLNALEDEGVESKRWVNKAGVTVGGTPMTRGALYYLLTNPVYRGVTRHKDKHYEDTHPAIIDQALWDAVQAKLADGNGAQPTTELRGEGARLQGKVFDDRGNAMVPVHTKRGAARYRYYVSRATLTGRGEAGSLRRISAGLLEQFLADRVAPLLSPAWRPQPEVIERVAPALRRIVLSEDRILVDVTDEALSTAVPDTVNIERSAGLSRISLAFHMRRRQGAAVLALSEMQTSVRPRLDRTLVRAVALARSWSHDLEAGAIDSVRALAKANGLCEHYLARLLPLAYLAPDLTEIILNGAHSRTVTLAALTASAMPLTWEAQRERFREVST